MNDEHSVVDNTKCEYLSFYNITSGLILCQQPLTMKRPIGLLRRNTDNSLMPLKAVMTLTHFLFIKATRLLSPTPSTVLSKTPWWRFTSTFVIIVSGTLILSQPSLFSSSFLKMVVNRLHHLTNGKIYVRVLCVPNPLMPPPLLFLPPHHHLLLLFLRISKGNKNKNDVTWFVIVDAAKSRYFVFLILLVQFGMPACTYSLF